MYYSAVVKTDKCNGCRICIMSCPEANAIAFHDQTRKVNVDQARCKGCGLCAAVCPRKALEITQL